MAHLYADTDAKFRNDVLSNTKHMIERIKGATAYLVREIDRMIIQGRQTDCSDAQQLLGKHEKFLTWFLGFLLGELVPTASYQRHITSLRAISLLLRSELQENSFEVQKVTTPDSTTWAHTLRVFNQESMRLILDLLMDPFEDVRSGATAILKLASPHNFQSTKCQRPTDFNILMEFIHRAEDFSKRTGRADYADGVARSYQILYGLLDPNNGRLNLVENLIDGLEKKVIIAQKDLGQAVLIAPIHSDFSTIRYTPLDP